MPPDTYGDSNRRPNGGAGEPHDRRAPCEEGSRCGSIALERNRYFTGKYMAARDFRDEQEYFLSRHRLHTRLLHGWGIVCGLTVEPHWDERCADRRVIVRRGIAIDCCGRELVLTADTVVEVWPQPDEGARDSNEPPPYPKSEEGERYPQGPTPTPTRYLVYLKYCEEPLECVPTLYDESCECQHGRHHEEANRIKEVPRVEAMPLDEAEPNCWPEPRGYGYPPEETYDACTDEPGPIAGCLDPDCSCDHLVPLAVIEAPELGRPITADHIDQSKRHELRTPPEYLTHVAHINWPHGGQLTLSQLRDMGGQLRVAFDRKILPNEGEANGVNEHTFIVQYGGVQRDLEFLPSTEDTPALVDEHVALFRIEEAKLNPHDRHGNIAGNVVYVTLKCDFIIDCHGNAVDGEHMNGRLPTGDGIKGGVFESWFRVLYD